MCAVSFPACKTEAALTFFYECTPSARECTRAIYFPRATRYALPSREECCFHDGCLAYASIAYHYIYYDVRPAYAGYLKSLRVFSATYPFTRSHVFKIKIDTDEILNHFARCSIVRRSCHVYEGEPGYRWNVGPLTQFAHKFTVRTSVPLALHIYLSL